jgi:hypothetical protein
VTSPLHFEPHALVVAAAGDEDDEEEEGADASGGGPSEEAGFVEAEGVGADDVGAVGGGALSPQAKMRTGRRSGRLFNTRAGYERVF